jgi:hypothetical protein
MTERCSSSIARSQRSTSGLLHTSPKVGSSETRCRTPQFPRRSPQSRRPPCCCGKVSNGDLRSELDRMFRPNEASWTTAATLDLRVPGMPKHLSLDSEVPAASLGGQGSTTTNTHSVRADTLVATRDHVTSENVLTSITLQCVALSSRVLAKGYMFCRAQSPACTARATFWTAT